MRCYRAQVAVDQLSMLSGRNCVAFVQVGSEVVCSPDELDSILNVANIRYVVIRVSCTYFGEKGTEISDFFDDVSIAISIQLSARA